MGITSKHVPIWLAFSGLMIQACGIGVAIFVFKNTNGSYSFLNNFVSELGAPRHTMMAQVFNWSIIISSIMLFPLMCSLGAHIRTKLSYIALFLGFCAMAGAVGCGFSPMDSLKPHLITAMTFFWAWMFAVLLFTVAFWRKYSFRESPVIVIAGIAAMISCILFLAVVFNAFHMSSSTPFEIKNPQAFKRPAIWDVAILEWCVVATLFAWNFVTTLYLMKQIKGTRSSEATGQME